MENEKHEDEASSSSYSIGEFANIDLFTQFDFPRNVLGLQSASRAILRAIRSGHTLPAHGDDYDYYSSFESFRSFVDIESSRLLEIIQKVMRYHGLKGNLTTSSAALELEDKFDVLVDANDQILERAVRVLSLNDGFMCHLHLPPKFVHIFLKKGAAEGTFIDEASGVKKETPLMIASTNNKLGTPQGSWNKKGRAAASSKGFSFRLLSARNIQRPQLKFKDKVDNTHRPFVPKIKDKPNALKSLTEVMAIQMEEEDHKTLDGITYPQPYHYELEHFKPTADQLAKRTPQMPVAVEETPLIFIDTVEALQKLCDDLKNSPEIAVDLEHHSYRSFLGITCLMQISTRTQDYIVDTLALRSDLQVLNEVFTDPKIVKVLHGADCDIEWLQRDLGLYIVNMFDTGQAARLLGFSRFSLAHLMQHFCGVDPDKQFQLADWRIRPLPEELIKYAREDTHYLLYIYDRMHTELLIRGNENNNLLQAAWDRSKHVSAKRYEKPVFNDQVHMELYKKSKKVFNSQQLHALKALYEWRDTTARTEDESTGYVLPNHMLLQIAETLPRDTQGVLACCNPIPPVVRQNSSNIHALIKAAREVPMQKVENTRSQLKPTRVEHPKYSVNALLHCPHDKSHARPDPPQLNVQDLIFITTENNSLEGLMATNSRLMGSLESKQPAQTGPKSTTSLVSVFDKQVETRANSKVNMILVKFANPFGKYFPLKPDEPSIVNISEKMTLSSLQDSGKWRLKAHTKRVSAMEEAEETGAPVLQTVVSSETMLFSPPTAQDKPIQPLRSQLPNKRALKKEAKSENQQSNNGESRNDTTEPNEKRSKTDSPGIPGYHKNLDGGKDKQQRPSVQQLQQQGFRSHDYSHTNYSTLFSAGGPRGRGRGGRGRGGDGRGRGGGRGNKRYYTDEAPTREDFNPHERETTSDHKSVGGPKLGGAGKSVTYKRGGGERKAKIQWPKR